jgi:hypothetical protein
MSDEINNSVRILSSGMFDANMQWNLYVLLEMGSQVETIDALGWRLDQSQPLTRSITGNYPLSHSPRRRQQR